MPRAFETISGRTVAAGATLTQVTMSTGDSARVRAAAPNTDIWLMQIASRHQADGIIQVRSPSLHDNVRGIRFVANTGNPRVLLGKYARQRLTRQDDLIISLSGSAVAGDIEHALLWIYYDDMPGLAGRYIGIDELMSRMANLVTIHATLTAGATGDYTGEESIEAESDLLKANMDYAWLGSVVDTPCGGVGLRGVDLGNIRLIVPGDPDQPDMTSTFWADMARRWQMDLIPVINSANAAGTLIDVLQNEDAAAVRVALHLAEMPV